MKNHSPGQILPKQLSFLIPGSIAFYFLSIYSTVIGSGSLKVLDKTQFTSLFNGLFLQSAILKTAGYNHWERPAGDPRNYTKESVRAGKNCHLPLALINLKESFGYKYPFPMNLRSDYQTLWRI